MVIQIDPEEPARFLAEWRRARRDRWRAIHLLLWLALPRSPSEMAAALLCARSTVYAVARGGQSGRRWPPLARASGPSLPYPFFPAQPVGLGAENTFCLRLVPYALEWRHTGFATAGTAGHPCVRRNRAPLLACAGLGVEAGETGGQGQRPGAHLETARIRCVFEPL